MPTSKAVIENELGHIKVELQEIKIMLTGDYIRKEEFDPIKKLVYGMVAIILTAVVTAVITIILKR
jgi:hypothetical protein